MERGELTCCFAGKVARVEAYNDLYVSISFTMQPLVVRCNLAP